MSLTKFSEGGALSFSTVSYLHCWNQIKLWAFLSFQCVVLPREVKYFVIGDLEIFLLEIKKVCEKS